jgi:amino acid transporter
MGLLTIMTTNNVVVALLASVGYMTAGYFITQLFFANLSRYLLAGSIDGVLPQALSTPSRTFKTPVNALIVVFVAFMAYALAIDLNTANLAFWLSVAVWTSACLFFGTNLAAIVIPRTNSSIYKSSPIARYRGVLVIAGIISFILSGFVIVGYLVIPQLEIGLGPLGGLVIGISAVLAVVWYAGWGAYQHRRGIEIGMAYREVPPE